MSVKQGSQSSGTNLNLGPLACEKGVLSPGRDVRFESSLSEPYHV
jgi:hypothetical protein